jgi:putative membrane-bound dehydrogenase-like protein
MSSRPLRASRGVGAMLVSWSPSLTLRARKNFAWRANVFPDSSTKGKRVDRLAAKRIECLVKDGQECPSYNVRITVKLDTRHGKNIMVNKTSRLLLIGGILLLCTTSAIRGDEKLVLDQLERSREEYTTADTWKARREELRTEFLRGAKLWPLPSRPNVVAQTHSFREYSGYSVENVALETLPGFYCTGNLYRPLAKKESSAIVLCPHGHFRPLGRMRESHQIRCAHLARMGATVFSYSMVGWQDSSQTTHEDPLALALQTWNSIRVVDYMTSLQRVDPTRVGVTGASGGGTQSMFLALVDDRVKAVAPLVIVYPWVAAQGCNCEGGMPIMKAADTNAIELASAIAPRPQLLISVGNDPTEKFPQVGFPFMQQMYGLAGAKDRVQNIHLASEAHDFGPTKRREVYKFLAQNLRIQGDGFFARKSDPFVEDLKSIQVETAEQLAVFDDAHRLPSSAIRGSAAIAAAFDDHLTSLRRADDLRVSSVATTIDDADEANYSFQPAAEQDEALLFTPPGFPRVGDAARASGAQTGKLSISVVDADTGEPTPCRINVVASDGDFYQPTQGHLRGFSLTGVWPKSGWGNRQGKAPIRYLGRFFYSTGSSTVEVPAGVTRVEVWKGFEYTPVKLSTSIRPGETREVKLSLRRTADMTQSGYWSGDPHIHIARRHEEDERRIFDLLEAEGIHYGTILAYNEPAGKYVGEMTSMDSPQFRGLGHRSVERRGDITIISGEEYRSGTYGHLNLFGLDRLALPGQQVNTNNWPPYGHVVRAARAEGAIAFYAHGGYAKAIYGDVAQGLVDGVELLQFGVYRGIGLNDWYHMLNTGFRLPASGACDYPACRKLGDCKTYVYSPGVDGAPPSMKAWLEGMKNGQSFFTSGPLILLDVDGQKPGAQIHANGDSKDVHVTVRVRSDVAPVTDVQLIANGKVLKQFKIPVTEGIHSWIEFSVPVRLKDSSWIAARAFSLSKNGTPDAESHTNPVYVYLNGKAPYVRRSLDVFVTAVDRQIAAHKKREFAERAQVISYFERSRDILMNIRAAGGAPAKGHPSQTVIAEPAIEDPGRRDHTDEELKAFLKPMPAKSIDEVIRSFETLPGFEMQLVAKEPLVHDPIAAAFDENGNLYVCEMRDYPYKPREGKPPIGTLRLLKDLDGDGTFDESHVFADNLLWAGGVAPWKGGVFVAAPPNIWYMKDTDGDNRADLMRKMYTGFGTGNQQAMLNNLTWGLDHKIYGSTAGNGGTVSYADGVNEQQWPEPISVTGRDFRFDPVTNQFEAITGSVQFGNSFDDWGNRFLCSESRPLLTAVLPERYLSRNPYLPVPSAIHHLTSGPVPIFRISPLERWRMIRSSRRIASGSRSPDSAGASHHVIDAAAGVTIYRGGAYPAEYYGNVFIGGAQSNLIHRRILQTDGVTFSSRRADEGTEFVRSSDNWFRPVNFINAPDGTLYVLDMSREILETIHVPLDVTKFVDFTSGREHGRIYRLAPTGYHYPGPPRLADADGPELVHALESQHGWWRDTAHRLIYERQDRSMAPFLRLAVRRSQSAQARLHALWSLHGLDSLTDADLLMALQDDNFYLREHAMRLSEPRLDDNPRLLAAVMQHSSHANPRLRLQAAFSLGESRSDQAAATLATMARTSASDRWIRTAVLSSAGELADRMLIEILNDASTPDGKRLMTQLASVVGARNRMEEVSRVMTALAEQPASRGSVVRQLVLDVASATRRSGVQMRREKNEQVDRMLADIYAQAKATVANEEVAEVSRVQAADLLACADLGFTRSTFQDCLNPQQPEAVQLAAVHALAGYSSPVVAEDLLIGWRQYSPALRKVTVDTLLSRTSWTQQYLQAAAREDVTVSLVDSTRRNLLKSHKDDVIRNLATSLFDESEDSRAAIVKRYERALHLVADAKRGTLVYQQNCVTCHRIGTQGHVVGPDLTSAGEKDAAALLAHVLNPNQYLLPNFETYVVVDNDGRTRTGMIAAQTSTSITLKREEGKSETILRANIDELTSTGKSLMPEGFEQKIDQQQMADLLAFLSSQTNTPPIDPNKLPIGTLPGLIEPK